MNAERFANVIRISWTSRNTGGTGAQPVALAPTPASTAALAHRRAVQCGSADWCKEDRDFAERLLRETAVVHRGAGPGTAATGEVNAQDQTRLKWRRLLMHLYVWSHQGGKFLIKVCEVREVFC